MEVEVPFHDHLEEFMLVAHEFSAEDTVDGGEGALGEE